jgi:hypothetical protein
MPDHLTLRIEFWGYCIPSPPIALCCYAPCYAKRCAERTTRTTELLEFEPAQARSFSEDFVCVAAISNRQVQDVGRLIRGTRSNKLNAFLVKE